VCVCGVGDVCDYAILCPDARQQVHTDET